MEIINIFIRMLWSLLLTIIIELLLALLIGILFINIIAKPLNIVMNNYMGI